MAWKQKYEDAQRTIERLRAQRDEARNTWACYVIGQHRDLQSYVDLVRHLLPEDSGYYEILVRKGEQGWLGEDGKTLIHTARLEEIQQSLKSAASTTRSGRRPTDSGSTRSTKLIAGCSSARSKTSTRSTTFAGK